MRSLVIVVTLNMLLAAAALPSNAQEAERPLRLGATFGVSSASIQGPGAPDQAGSRAALKGGVEVYVLFQSSPFAMVSGLSMVGKGAQMDDGVADYEVSLTYLQLPAMAEVTFGSPVTFYSRMGPYLSLLQQARRKGTVFLGTNEFTGEQTTESVDKSITDGLQSLNAGIRGGFGIRFPFFNGKLGARVMVERSLSEITKPSATTVFSRAQARAGNQYNRAVTISLHYSLPIADL